MTSHRQFTLMIWSSLNFGNSSKSRLKMDGSRLKLAGNRDRSMFDDVLSAALDNFSSTLDDFDVSDFIVSDDDDDDDVPILENSSSNFSHIFFESSIIWIEKMCRLKSATNGQPCLSVCPSLLLYICICHSITLSVRQSINLSISLSIYLCVQICLHPSVCLLVFLPSIFLELLCIYLFVCQSVIMFVFYVCPMARLSVCLSAFFNLFRTEIIFTYTQ